MTTGHGLSGEQIALLRSVLARYAPPIDRVDLFGSRALGTARAASDIDLLVCGKGVDSRLIDRLWTELNDLPLPFTVDVLGEAAELPAALRAHLEAAATPLFRFSPPSER